MIIHCFRCGKPIETPNASNSDYITAEDTKAEEARECVVAIKHTKETLSKAEKAEVIDDSEYTVTPVSSFEEAKMDVNTVRVEVRMLPAAVQKTGIICPDCHRVEDFIIWGVHKGFREKK